MHRALEMANIFRGFNYPQDEFDSLDRLVEHNRKNRPSAAPIELINLEKVDEWLTQDNDQCMLCKNENDTSGLNWRKNGKIRPSKGTELTNEKLATALQTKLEFGQVEWDAFGVKGITIDHFIKAGDSYFQPDNKVYKELCQLVQQKVLGVGPF